MSIVAKRLDGLRCHLVWSNGGRPRPRRHCVRRGPSYPKGGTAPLPLSFRPMSVVAMHTAGYHLVVSTTEYGGRARPRQHCVMGTKLPPTKRGHSSPIFGPCLLWPNGWMDQCHLTEIGLGPGQTVLDGDPYAPPPKKGHSPQFSAHVCCRPSQLLLSTCNFVSLQIRADLLHRLKVNANINTLHLINDGNYHNAVY